MTPEEIIAELRQIIDYTNREPGTGLSTEHLYGYFHGRNESIRAWVEGLIDRIKENLETRSNDNG